jgi:hypothetical protein
MYDKTCLMDDKTCFITCDQLREKLENIEKQLTVVLKLNGSAVYIHNELLRRAKNGELPETELVEQWDECYSIYKNCKKD